MTVLAPMTSPTTMLTLALSLASLLDVRVHAARPAAPELVTRTYQLATVMPARHGSDYNEVLAPYLWRDRGRYSPTHLGAEGLDDSIAELVMRLFESEFTYEGRAIDYDEGRLRVVAPPKVQEEIQRVLSYLEGTFRRSVELRIDIVERGNDAAPLAGVVTAKEADELIAGGGARVRSHTLRVVPGRIATLDATHEIGLVADYDVEIAERTSQFDPIVLRVGLGTRISARAAIVPGGVRVALLLRDGNQIGDVRERHLGLGALITTEAGSRTVTEAVPLQALSLLHRSLALNLAIADGSVAVIESSVALQTGTSRVAILVRAGAERREPYSSLILAGESARLEIVDLSYVCPPIAHSFGGLLERDRFPHDFDRFLAIDESDEEPVYANTVAGSTSWIEEHIASDLHEQMSLSPWLIAFARKPDPASKLPPSLFGPDSGVFEQAAPSQGVVVGLTLRRTGAGGTVLARASLPAVVGEQTTAILGGETLYIGDADVEVAQGASTIDPILSVAFDGLAVALTPQRTNDGATVLDLCARANVLAGPLVPITVGAPLTLECERAESDDLWLDERLEFAAQGGARRVTFAGGKLALEIELR